MVPPKNQHDWLENPPFEGVISYWRLEFWNVMLVFRGWKHVCDISSFPRVQQTNFTELFAFFDDFFVMDFQTIQISKKAVSAGSPRLGD